MGRQDNRIEPGTVIDSKYEIGRIIGSGGMGTVYEATQVGIQRKVALKLLHGKYAKSAKIVKRFHQEARLAGSIAHDNICRVTDHGSSEDGAPYLVMPLLEGRSLTQCLSGGGGLSHLRVIDIICQTLLALEAAHKEKIVHRDLKPDNIFVTKVGDREDFVKLLDFGISKVLEQESASDLTSTGMVLGTAYYLAPEQARGAKRIDHRVDIYAMGVILYESLTGTRPFEGETYNEVMFKIAGEPFKTPRSLNKTITPAVEGVILQAMAIDPNERFSTALEMCEALEKAAVSSLGPDTSPMGDTMADTSMARSPIAAKKANRKRLIYGLLVSLGILGGIVVLWMSLENTSPEPQKNVTDPAPVPTPESRPAALPVENASKSAPPVIEADTAQKNGSPNPTPASEIDNAAKTVTDPTEKATPQKSSKKKRVKNDKKVIKGRFGTTFIFEE